MENTAWFCLAAIPLASMVAQQVCAPINMQAVNWMGVAAADDGRAAPDRGFIGEAGREDDAEQRRPRGACVYSYRMGGSGSGGRWLRRTELGARRAAGTAAAAARAAPARGHGACVVVRMRCITDDSIASY